MTKGDKGKQIMNENSPKSILRGLKLRRPDFIDEFGESYLNSVTEIWNSLPTFTNITVWTDILISFLLVVKNQFFKMNFALKCFLVHYLYRTAEVDRQCVIALTEVF